MTDNDRHEFREWMAAGMPEETLRQWARETPEENK